MYLYRHFGKRSSVTDVVLDKPEQASAAKEWFRNHGMEVDSQVIRSNLEKVEVRDGAAFQGSVMVSDRLNFVY